jgi:hypothetical protein
VFLPNWPLRFQNDEFKLYAEQMVHENTPAHLAAACHWLPVHEMHSFEKLYREWRSLKQAVTLAAEAASHGPVREQTATLDEASRRLKQFVVEAMHKKHAKKSTPQRPAAPQAGEL